MLVHTHIEYCQISFFRIYILRFYPANLNFRLYYASFLLVFFRGKKQTLNPLRILLV